MLRPCSVLEPSGGFWNRASHSPFQRERDGHLVREVPALPLKSLSSNHKYLGFSCHALRCPQPLDLHPLGTHTRTGRGVLAPAVLQT